MSIKTTRDCATSILGTGTNGCRILKKYIERRFLIQKGYKFDKLNDTLDDATINNLIQKGLLIPLPTNVAAEPNHQEPTYETVGKLDMFVSGVVYSWILRYPADACLTRALDSLGGRNWDLIEVDEDGYLNLAETSDGFLKGFDVNLSRYVGMVDNDGSTSAKSSFRIQLTKLGSKEYDSRWTTVASDEVDWLSLNGVDEILFSQTADGKLQAAFACDQTSAIDGLTTANVRAVDSTGAVVAGFTLTAIGEGKYTVGGLTAGQDYTIYTYDSAKQANVVVIGNYFYKSNRLLFTA